MDSFEAAATGDADVQLPLVPGNQWQVHNEVVHPEVTGNFYVYDTNSALAPVSGLAVPPHAGETRAILGDQNGPGRRVLLHPFRFQKSCNCPAVQVTYDRYVVNYAGVYVPGPINLAHSSQYSRVDILGDVAGLSSPYTTSAAELVTVLEVHDADIANWATVSFNVALPSSGSYSLRFAEIETLFFYNFGIDNVKISAFTLLPFFTSTHYVVRLNFFTAHPVVTDCAPELPRPPPPPPSSPPPSSPPPSIPPPSSPPPSIPPPSSPPPSSPPPSRPPPSSPPPSRPPPSSPPPSRPPPSSPPPSRPPPSSPPPSSPPSSPPSRPPPSSPPSRPPPSSPPSRPPPSSPPSRPPPSSPPPSSPPSRPPPSSPTSPDESESSEENDRPDPCSRPCMDTTCRALKTFESYDIDRVVPLDSNPTSPWKSPSP
ncbi:MAG: hypothetical protein MHM6MM_004167 [Cercozoa sp. M6MM]